MTRTESFFTWFFEGISGLGGWFIFLLLALAGVIWMLYDSSKRRIPALGWRLGAILSAFLLLPTIIFRFGSAETQLSLLPFVETFFYLGLLGGILPVVLAVGYYVTYQGMQGCPNGHVYDAKLGKCPQCAPAQVAPPMPAPRPQPVREPARGQEMPPSKPKANAWLVDPSGRNYQLCQGESTIGRSSTCDVQFSGVSSVSRNHAKIVQKNGRFYLTDLASSSGTKVNGQFIRQTTLLEPNDEVQFSDQVKVTFVTTNH